MGNLCTSKKVTRDEELNQKYGRYKLAKSVQTDITIDSNGMDTLVEDYESLRANAWSNQLISDNNANILELYSNTRDNYQSYKISYIFKIKMNTESNYILDWSHKKNNGDHMGGISILQGSTDYGDRSLDFGDLRYLWMEIYDNKGANYWPKLRFIPLGKHCLNVGIQMSVHVNEGGIIVYYSSNGEGIETISSGMNSNGFIFSNVDERPLLNVNFGTIDLISLKLMTDDDIEVPTFTMSL